MHFLYIWDLYSDFLICCTLTFGRFNKSNEYNLDFFQFPYHTFDDILLPKGAVKPNMQIFNKYNLFSHTSVSLYNVCKFWLFFDTMHWLKLYQFHKVLNLYNYHHFKQRLPPSFSDPSVLLPHRGGPYRCRVFHSWQQDGYSVFSLSLTLFLSF